jgi:pro-kumamolisin-like protein
MSCQRGLYECVFGSRGVARFFSRGSCGGFVVRSMWWFRRFRAVAWQQYSGVREKSEGPGEADLGTMMTATVWLKLYNENLLDRLTSDQYNKKSLGFRKWISQNEFNSNFSPTAQEVKAVSNFLSAHGLLVVETAENNFFVKVQGTVADMEKTFHVSIHKYSYRGQTYRSNSSDPSLDKSSGAHCGGDRAGRFRL